MHKQFPSLIANQNLCDKGAKVEARSNKAGVRGDRLQLGEKQRKDVGVVWHVHLARWCTAVIFGSHPSQKNRSWNEVTSLCSSSGDKVDNAVKDRGEDLLLDLLHSFLRFSHRGVVAFHSFRHSNLRTTDKHLFTGEDEDSLQQWP